MSTPLVPLLTADIPGTGGELRREPEDFIVEEIPAYEPSGKGDHTYLMIEKRGLTTIDVAKRIASVLRVRERDVGFAGMKDRHAVTRQQFSVEHVDPDRAREALTPVANVTVLEAARHGNKLRLGHLRGNRFEVRIRDVRGGALASAQATLDVLTTRGCPNGFGVQRFGRAGDNHRVGRRLVRGDAKAVGKSAPRRVVRLLVSAYQSALFNRLVTERLTSLDRLEDGDLAYLHDRGAVFRVDDAAKEQPRADAFEISPSGPLFGTRTTLADGAQGERERALLAEEGLSLDAFARTPAGSFRGERRPMRIPVADATVTEEVTGESTSLVVSFTLPRGSFATAVLGEITGG